MSINNPTNDKEKQAEEAKFAAAMKKAAEENPELSQEELKKIVGGKLGAPIFKKKP